MQDDSKKAPPHDNTAHASPLPQEPGQQSGAQDFAGSQEPLDATAVCAPEALDNAMDPQELIRRLTIEKRAALNALELAGSLSSFSISLNRLDSPLPILLETAQKLRTLVRFSSFGFFLVDEKDGDLRLAHAEPEAQSGWIEKELERLIEDQTLAWVLQRAKPVLLSDASKKHTLLLHSLATVSRTRGVFVGVLGQGREEIIDPFFSLLTIIFHGCAQALESFSLYGRIRTMNRQLSEHVATLEFSELALQERGQALEDVAARHSMDLEIMHKELSRHMTALQRTQEECQRHEAFLRAVLDNGAFGVAVFDRFGAILHCNERVARLYGFTEEAGPGRLLRDVATPEIARLLAGEHAQVFSSGRSLTAPEQHINSLVHGSHLKAVFLVDDPATGAQAVCRLLLCIDCQLHPGHPPADPSQAGLARREAMQALGQTLLDSGLDSSQQFMLRSLLDLAGASPGSPADADDVDDADDPADGTSVENR